ncbi:hypothetical protein CHS0354_024699 [Potamilus streckersoni]|uniref:Uncharacterized protein n=1 Tax=Potamilus streckersoni TaxID=2493646 RepID=A0AAE0RWY5_9BIVA|nr:hypothetical protein CHS0354_024699 [Potamilus streckersoni]
MLLKVPLFLVNQAYVEEGVILNIHIVNKFHMLDVSENHTNISTQAKNAAQRNDHADLLAGIAKSSSSCKSHVVGRGMCLCQRGGNSYSDHGRTSSVWLSYQLKGPHLLL